MKIGDNVEIISRSSRKNRNQIGKIVKECPKRYSERMFIVEFLEGKAKYYESSLKVVEVDEDIYSYALYI